MTDECTKESCVSLQKLKEKKDELQAMHDDQKQRIESALDNLHRMEGGIIAINTLIDELEKTSAREQEPSEEELHPDQPEEVIQGVLDGC